MKRSMDTAPTDGTVIEAYNPVIGWYRTAYEGGEWPCRSWGGTEGNWYPAPTQWRPIGEHDSAHDARQKRQRNIIGRRGEHDQDRQSAAIPDL